MLTKKQVTEIREHLEKAQNPLFFFDNDQDGLCSFLLLRRYIGRGRGVAARSFPGLNKEYFKKVHELQADYIFILDKPVVDSDFFDEAAKVNIPIVWIDHHAIDKTNIPDFVFYYNPIFNKKKSSEPVTALCWQLTGKEEDAWIAVVGCISDRFIPKFYSKVEKKFPELMPRGRRIFDIFYKSQIGRIAQIFGAGLKDKTTNVVNMLRFLIKAKSPYDVLEESSANKEMHHRFKQIDSKYQKFFIKALTQAKKSDKFIFFQYGGDLSISAEIANELNYVFPEKIIVVAYIKEGKTNISMRGKNVRQILLEAIKDLEDATGGGHEFAVGARIKTEDIEKFKKNLEKIIK